MQCTDITFHRQCSTFIYMHVHVSRDPQNDTSAQQINQGQACKATLYRQGEYSVSKRVVLETPTWEGVCAGELCCGSPEGLGIEVGGCCCWLFVLPDACWPGPAGGLACPRLRPWLLASDSWGMANTLWGCDLKDPAEGAAACSQHTCMCYSAVVVSKDSMC